MREYLSRFGKGVKSQSFFDRWSFYGSWDNLTLGKAPQYRSLIKCLSRVGDVNWVDRNTAFSSNLVRIDSAQNAIIKVDNVSFVPWQEKRNTVRIESLDTYSLGRANWPEEGEIDIIEGVNRMQYNHMALHTEAGCIQVPGANQLGTSGENPDCSQGTGCVVQDTTVRASYGPIFNGAGGGVWATQFDVAGVFIWFWDVCQFARLTA
ncbi:glycoside hydrolase family 16 protein [Sphaerobolus stellatus SS14]|uniref:Glycoside hydrolase family 16 protein n=1 Tax=Sphaerobolus stellatus (strain SS14) TaxID=990650 RepID=A0A0C9VJ28_SPHS4|nr:glycoside hydrolase family 16 protein [Sphaerobolus stellatus SS14]